MNKTHEKLRTLSPLDRLGIEVVCTNIEKWDSIWKDIKGNEYKGMTKEEMRKSYASLNVIANKHNEHSFLFEEEH